MLNKLQMELVEHVFSSMKDMLFASGKVPQSYIITKGGDALVFPLPPSMRIGSGISMEMIEKLCEVEDTELVIFVSEIWSVTREADSLDKETLTDENWQDLARQQLGNGKSPSQQPDKSESLMMLVLEVDTKKLHMKTGAIQRDSKGGAYIEDDEWLPEADLTVLKTTAFPSKLYH
jgi:hypothetical protein